MKKIIAILIIALMLGCQTATRQVIDDSPLPDAARQPDIQTDKALLLAEAKATPPGKKILFTGRQMIEHGEIIRGGCWDYANAVYNRSGYPAEKREGIFKSSKTKGPYADANRIQPGDWVYHINHSYGKGEHSGIFVYWVDFEEKIGMMISYAGERRREPARYESYDLSNVYHIVRAKP